MSGAHSTVLGSAGVATDATPLIAHLIYRLDVGGLENGIVNIINRSRGRGVRHAIICLTGATDFRRRIDDRSVRIEEVGKRPGKDVAHYARVWRILRELKPQVLHTRNLATLEYQWLAWLAGVPIRIHGEHGWDAADLGAAQPRGRRIRRLTAPLVHRFVAMSQDLARWLERDIGISARRVAQFYNGVDLERFRPLDRLAARARTPFKDPDLVLIGTVGRLTPIKSQVTLLEAFARLCASGAQSHSQRLRLMIVGDGPLLEELRGRAHGLGIADQVWFAGACDDVAGMLPAMDIFVLPSLNEGISNTVLEAMASGLPVVATDVGGNRELIVDGTTGRLCAPSDAAGLAAVIGEYLDKPDLRAAHGAAGRRRVEAHFALERMVDEYLALYGSLLAGRA